MNIRPKMIPMFQEGKKMPSTVTWSNPDSTWFTRSGNNILEGTYNYIKPFYDKWKSSGKQEDYQAYKKAVDALNSDQRYGYAPGHLRYQSGNNQLFKDDSVGAWQNIVRRNYNYINDSLGKNINQYHIESSNPYSGDNPSQGWKIDKLWAGETDDRTTWGNLQNENDSEYQKWKQKFSEIGIDYRTNPEWNTGNVLYGFLKDPQDSPNTSPSQTSQQKITGVNPTEKLDPKNDFWQRLSAGFNKIAPDLLAAVRYAGNMHNNERVYNEMKQAIIPNLQGTYTTHRQIVGDEATKQAYYRRAAQGESKAAKAFTADADRQMAYMMEAKRVGDELRAQGDLADNQEIRRTSDESNQHQWANAQRANEVANANITELNKAKAAKHQLAAQKYTADWTNTDQYLLGWESKFKQKQAEEKELERQLALLDTKEDLLNDTTLRDLRTAADDAYNAYSNETDAAKKAALKQKYEKAIKDYQLYNIQKTRLNLRRQYEGVYTAKTGTKITKKDNSDKFLYKTSRDIVEHFRRMSKMTDDSRIRTMPKPAKLSSHPRKMQLGGVAPFTIYRPLGATGGETTTQTSTGTDSKSSKDTAAKDKLDMIKELFKQVQGLPVDVSQVYQHMVGVFNKARAFGEEMSSDDIAAMYLSSMNEIAKLKYSQKAYEDARNVAVANDAMNEIAVGANGEIALYDSENQKVKRGSLKQLKESDGKLTALTNGQLLTMRAHSPNLAFDDQVFDIVNNGIGMSKIATHIKSIAGTIGSMETKIEGITKVESDKIKSGLKELAEAPEGYYKITQEKKDSSANINAALNYIYSILPKNYRTILELNSNGNGQKLIYSMLVSQVKDYDKMDIDPLSGKAANKEEKDSSEKIKSNPLMQLIQGEGGVPRTWNLITKDSNVKMSVDGIEYSQLPKITEDMSLDKMLSESGIAGILDSKQGITFGDQSISPDQLKDVMYSNSGGMVVTLPCKIVNGHKEVNLGIKKTYEEAIQEVESKGISKNSSEYYKMLGEVLKQKGLNSLLDSNGYPDRNKFGQFLVVEAYTTDKIKNLDTSSQYIEKVKNPDAQLEERMIKALSTDSKKSNYNLDIDYWLYGDDVYRGTVFIPLNNNLNAAINASGNQISVENARELENKFQNFNKASNMKSSNSDVL